MFEQRTLYTTRVRITLDEGTDQDHPVRCTIMVLDPALRDHSATFRIVQRVRVHDSRGIGQTGFPFEREIRKLGPQQVIDIPREALRVYSYKGSMIDVEVVAELIVDDGFFSDTEITISEAALIDRPPAIASQLDEIVDPSDAFDFLANLAAIPPVNRIITIGLLLFGLVVIGANSVVGWHDQVSPETEVWVYDHHDSDGDSQSPLVNSLMASGALGTAVWLAMRKQLRKYMTFELVPLDGHVRRSHVVLASRLVKGRSRVDLHDVHLRIVACNMEKGQYKRGSGTDERTVSFSEPSRAVVLYETRVDLIPANRPVEQFLRGDVRFEPMFRALYPRQMTSSTHGVDLHWEIQLIHDELVDQEIICPCESFIWEEFVEA